MSKRFAIVIQHEVIIYAADEAAAEAHIKRHTLAAASIISIRELPQPIDEEHPPIIDGRKAPGA